MHQIKNSMTFIIRAFCWFHYVIYNYHWTTNTTCQRFYHRNFIFTIKKHLGTKPPHPPPSGPLCDGFNLTYERYPFRSGTRKVPLLHHALIYHAEYLRNASISSKMSIRLSKETLKIIGMCEAIVYS